MGFRLFGLSFGQRMNIRQRSWAFYLLLTLTLGGCRQGGSVMPLSEENAAYYWRTTWSIDSVESAFLQRYDIRRLYCRYFDVVMADGQPTPNATLRFPAVSALPSTGDSVAAFLPSGLELVPTVYITEDCMRAAPDGGWAPLARKLVARIVQMNDTHDLPPAQELQVDCDYTLRSRQNYYDFLAIVREEARKRGMRLSTTIRLHQLSMAAPPADYGVLMVYNTGDPQNFAERNPILDIRDVEPYLRHLAGYKLPLAAAYPVYRWQRTIHGVRIEHSVDGQEILNAKKMVERERSDMGRTIIIYSLDKENINRYDHDTFLEIYRH